MNKQIIWLLMLTISAAQADFNDAMDAYQNKQFSTAHKEFNRLAKIGNKRAQFNLGVMYLNGEHVSQDAIAAYAWGKLSEHPNWPEFSRLSQSLLQKFSETELKQAEMAHDELKTLYGDARIYADLSPISYRGDESKTDEEPTYQLKVIKRKPPRFPKEAFDNRIQGWTTVGFEIHPDGTARNPYVIDAYPENTFENESIRAIQNFKFDVQFNAGTEPEVLYRRQTIEYSLEKMANESKLRQYYDERLDQLKHLANQGSATGQYLYAIAASSNLLNKDNKISKTEVNDWLLKAAQNGHIDAQYLLGKNILKGEGCQVEKQKGIDWIVYAAEQGHPRSSRMAYTLLTKHNNLNNTNLPPEHWLKLSADKGDADSQINYAEFLATQENASANDLIQARQYLEKQTDQRNKTVKWYQISSMLYTKQGDSKKANKHQKKAMKLAKKLGWNLNNFSDA